MFVLPGCSGWVVSCHRVLTLRFLATCRLLPLLVLRRFGFLCYAVGYFFFLVLTGAPLTTDLSVWYAGTNLVCVAVLLGLAAYGFVLSLAGRPLLRESWLQEA